MVNLTEIWRSCGEPKSKNAGNWAMGAGKNIISQVFTNSQECVIQKRPGSKGGTWATAPIALAYAKWLGEEVYLELLNQLFDNSELILDIQGMTKQELIVFILEGEQ